jgi:hypothetical protein
MEPTAPPSKVGDLDSLRHELADLLADALVADFMDKETVEQYLDRTHVGHKEETTCPT